jgi:putative ABC transport system permease protein
MNLWHDAKYAVRVLTKDRWMALAAVVTLALGIGANGTVFTCVNAVLLRGLPYAQAGRILHINSRVATTGENAGVSYPDFLDMRAGTHAFESLAAFQDGTMNVSDADHPPERLAGAWLTANAFDVLGQRPLLGRSFVPTDDRPGADPVVVLGHGVWADRYGADRGIIGRTIKINEVPATVIGVMPAGVKFPVNADLWQAYVPSAGEQQKRGMRFLSVFGRVRAGSSPAQAQAEMNTIASRLSRQYPETNASVVADVMPFNERFNGGPIKLVFLAMMGAVGFVLLIACANVANLMLARSSRRAREIAVRVALGATRWQIGRQLLVESLIVAIAATGFGLALSVAGTTLFDRAVEGTGKPYWIQFTVDYTVLAFLVAVCAATAVLSGLAPALHVSRTDVHETLKEGGRGGSAGKRARRFSSSLVVAELALTVALLAGAGFMIRSFLTLYRMDYGVRAERVLTMRLMLADRKYPRPDDWMAFHDRLSERFAAVPGLAASSLASNLPLGGGGQRELEIEGQARNAALPSQPAVTVITVGPGYFETLELPIRRGRAFRSQDGRPGAEAAIVSERWVERFAPRENPVGRRIRLKTEGNASPWLTIVGVSPSVQQRSPQAGEDVDPVVYVPFRQEPGRAAFVLARGNAAPTALAKVLREEVRQVDADQPVFRVRSLADALAEARWPYRVFGGLLGVFALIALVLSAVGIYAVTSYAVAQRRQEIGVRMALGANGAQVTWLVMRRAAWQLGLGLGVGLAAAVGVGRVLHSIVVRGVTGDPATYLVVVGIFVAVTVLASIVPSRRATRLDPLAVLRAE